MHGRAHTGRLRDFSEVEGGTPPALAARGGGGGGGGEGGVWGALKAPQSNRRFFDA